MDNILIQMHVTIDVNQICLLVLTNSLSSYLTQLSPALEPLVYDTLFKRPTLTGAESGERAAVTTGLNLLRVFMNLALIQYTCHRKCSLRLKAACSLLEK